MSTVNYELGKLSKKDTYPVYARIDRTGIGRKRVRLSTSANKNDVADGKIVNKMVLCAVNEELCKIERDVLLEDARMGMLGSSMNDKMRVILEDIKIDFIEYGRGMVKQMDADGRIRTARSYTTALNNFCNFLGAKTLDINCVNKMLLQKYEKWFKQHNFGTRAFELYMTCLQAIHNAAKREFNDDDEGIMVVKGSPFSKIDFHMSKAEKRKIVKRALTADAILAIAEAPYSGDYRTDLARDAFMLSFFFCGMNAVDLYYYNRSLNDGYIEFYRRKTEGRSGEDSFLRIKIQPEAVPFINSLEGVKNTFLFAEKYATNDCLNQALNIGLKSLAKHVNGYCGKEVVPENLTFYAARHTWSTIASNDCGIPTHVIDKGLCHVSSSIAMQSYIKKSYEDVDAANRKVIDFVFGK